MPLRPPAGFISANYDPLRNPDAPTGVTATAGDAQASVSFTAPANVGGSAISAYYAVSNPNQITVSGASSPITVTGLTNGTAYTFQVWALNTFGPGAFSAASGSVTPVQNYGIFAGGNPSGTMINVIQYVVISTTGNAVDVGDLLTPQGRGNNGTISSTSRGIIAAGSDNSGYVNVIQYFTIATSGNSADFGDCSGVEIYPGGCSNSTRGIIAGGDRTGPGKINIIEYVTIATLGNAVDFGDLTQVWEGLSGLSSPTRGVFACSSSLAYNAMNYITIATTGNAVSFGDLNNSRSDGGACSNSTKGIWGGGYLLPGSTITNDVQGITIATTGNTTSFGTLSVARRRLNAVSNQTRGIFAGGETTSSVNVLDYLTFSAGGAAADFGDLLAVNKQLFTISNAHGGL